MQHHLISGRLFKRLLGHPLLAPFPFPLDEPKLRTGVVNDAVSLLLLLEK